MKQITTIIASLLFSIIFFQQNVGLNLLLFTSITIAFLIISVRQKVLKKRTLLLAFAYIISGVLVFVHNSGLSIITNCALFFSLIGSISEHKTSVYVKWLNGIYTSIAGTLQRNFETDNDTENVNKKTNIDALHLTKLIAIPLVFITIFVLLYKNGNPVFNDLVSKISFEFINLQWILFTVLGYFLFSNISKPMVVEPATTLDLKTGNELFKTETFSEDKLKKEKQLGTTLLGLLNVLLVFFIVTDIMSLMTMDTSKASELSDLVHSGINTLIASILIAIAIILYFFRGNLNFYSENRILKHLTFIWIALNIMLIVLIAIKNQNYITSFGLTYKRIGVHIYIFLTLVGLITTLLKVLNIKNLVFLFRKNTQIAFATLVILSTVNWDNIITNYNLSQASSYDIGYLIDLSDRNAILLHDKKDDVEISTHNRNRIITKYSRHIKNLESQNWQELTFEKLTFDKNHNTY
ncbi:DUF4173 domain-containing protein [Psychroserpens sp. Hel_I_66]|uniref:DUF4153 domain-containing protein n=1 Tax=Psychroserpens sp. Hel_I_66 TaxID=1250004 RepID=UPI000647D5B5|nr:DUF4173 domain-containing protein [Psychroserpens sp. Hel_I_66]